MKNDKNTKEEEKETLVEVSKDTKEPEETASTSNVAGANTAAANVNEDSDCKEKIADLENQVKRTLADYQNLEKRVREDRIHWIKSANKDLLLRFLPVLDTLILASKHSEDKSLQVSIGQFLQALKDEGVERIEVIGKHFDPNTMEAIGAKEGKEGEVLEETRVGYKLNNNILRVAQVIVGKKGDSETSSE